jgi:hypothetical protein
MNGGANHIGPESRVSQSCVSHREVWGDALTGGPVLSHVTKTIRDADAFCVAEGSMAGCAIASARPVPAWSGALARRRNLLFANREISWLTVWERTVRVGKAEADDARR